MYIYTLVIVCFRNMTPSIIHMFFFMLVPFCYMLLFAVLAHILTFFVKFFEHFSRKEI